MIFGAEGYGCDEDTATKLIRRYLDAGGNVIDTADTYRGSERICGRALQGLRDQVVVSTKFGMPVGAGPNERGAGRVRIRAACESSLRRLGTDRIDLYWLHIDDLDTPLEETISALHDLVRAGKVLYLGISNLRAYRVMKALNMCDLLGGPRFIAYQGDYNLMTRGLEREHFPLLAEENLGFLSWSPLAAGMLTGKIRADDDTEPTRLNQRSIAVDTLHKNDHGFAVAALVTKLAGRIGCTPAQLALAWQRSRPVASVILGARTLAQLDDNLASIDIDVPRDVLEELDLATAVPPEYPGAFIATADRWLQRNMTGAVHA
ncbi:aldo/keto reductase [Mycobacterium sp. 48b]|uniref:aldo/keto reductase n=1 Tax=Mycobacterium sp. 48b TaxID=3400426 RepID=UPI003AAB0266